MSECPYEADCDATAELCRTLRAEVERLTEANTRLRDTINLPLNEANKRTEQAEQELESTRHQLRDVANERNQAEQRIAELEQAEQRVTILDTTGRLMEIRAEQAEQERDRLREQVNEFENWLASLPYKP